MKVIQRRGDLGYLDRWLWVPKVHVSVDATKSALTHVLTDGYNGVERILYLWKETRDHLLVPRAFWDPIRLPFPIVDCRPQSYTQVNFGHIIRLDHRVVEFQGKMQLCATGKDVQKKSIAALCASPGGILQLACGKGKTVVALYKIATGRVPSLVMLDNLNLLYQWKKEAEKLLDVPGGIGIYADGRKEWKHGLVLATYHSIANWAETITEEERSWFGQVFWDEGHHVPALTFSQTADMFYGNRYSLTATPERSDGLHVVADVHIGPVLHKDLTPMMLPNFAFLWSGLELDLKDPTVASQVLDTNNEVHLSKVSSFFGQWPPRLNLLLNLVDEAVACGRRVLLLSNSVAEVVNLMAMYELGVTKGDLYTDIPIPTPQELGETVQPVELPPKELKKLQTKKDKIIAQGEKLLKKCGDATIQQAIADFATRLAEAKKKLGSAKAKAKVKEYDKEVAAVKEAKEQLFIDFCSCFQNASMYPHPDIAVVEAELVQVNQTFKQHEVHRKIMNEVARRQREYIKSLVEAAQQSGLLTYDVPAKTRQEMLASRQVTFAVTKYGKEGMDCPELDTVILSSLFSDRNGLQQLMGRPTRPMPGKKTPTLVAVVDNVGQCIGMSQKLITHLREWPREEGGPYNPILIGYPRAWNQQVATTKQLFGL